MEHRVRPARKTHQDIRSLTGAVMLLGVVLGAYFVSRASSVQPRATGSAAQVKTVTIPIEGMSCVACAARVKNALRSIDGVTAVEVSLAQRAAQVRYVEKKVAPQHLAAAVNKLGYKAGVPRTREMK